MALKARLPPNGDEMGDEMGDDLSSSEEDDLLSLTTPSSHMRARPQLIRVTSERPLVVRSGVAKDDDPISYLVSGQVCAALSISPSAPLSPFLSCHSSLAPSSLSLPLSPILSRPLSLSLARLLIKRSTPRATPRHSAPPHA